MKYRHSLLPVGFILLTCAFTIPLLAQTAGAPPTQRHHYFATLGLSPEQKAQIKQIRQETPKGKQRRQDIAAILTPEQKAQLRQEMAQGKSQDQ